MSEDVELIKILPLDWEDGAQIYCDDVLTIRDDFILQLEALQTRIEIPAIPGMCSTSDHRHLKTRMDDIMTIVHWLFNVMDLGYKKYGLDAGKGFQTEVTTNTRDFVSRLFDSRIQADKFQQGIVSVQKSEHVKTTNNLPHTLLALDILGMENHFDIYNRLSEINAEFSVYEQLDQTETGILGLINTHKYAYSVKPILRLPNFQASLQSDIEIDTKWKVYDLSTSGGIELLVNACCTRIIRSIPPETVMIFHHVLTRTKPWSILDKVTSGDIKMDYSEQRSVDELGKLFNEYQDKSQLLLNVARAIGEQDKTDTRKLLQQLSSGYTEYPEEDAILVSNHVDTYRRTYDWMMDRFNAPVVSYTVQQYKHDTCIVGGAFSTIESLTYTLKNDHTTRVDRFSETSSQTDKIIIKPQLLTRRILFNNEGTPTRIEVTPNADGTIDRQSEEPDIESTINQIKNVSLKTASWDDAKDVYDELEGTYGGLGQGRASVKMHIDDVNDSLITKLLASPYDFSFQYGSDRFDANVELSGLIKK